MHGFYGATRLRQRPMGGKVDFGEYLFSTSANQGTLQHRAFDHLADLDLCFKLSTYLPIGRRFTSPSLAPPNSHYFIMTLQSQDPLEILRVESYKNALRMYIKGQDSDIKQTDDNKDSVVQKPESASGTNYSVSSPPDSQTLLSKQEDPTINILSVDENDGSESEDGDPYLVAERRVMAQGYPHPAWTSKKNSRGLGEDSDASDSELASYNSSDDIYDSDLESEVSFTCYARREHQKKMRKWRSLATNKHEHMLLDCIVNIDEIPPNYADIVVDKSVIEKLENVTFTTLKRPRAFNHGVLKGNRVTGAVLYGPPGTGKSLLAKSLAKQSGFNMVSVSTAEIWQQLHGEDEKVIKALFSMGRKLQPCIIFLDEADAMLGTRQGDEKRHIRSMLNQFLMEWDGLASGCDAPFVLLATNRPFDLDLAVLRRAPMHILLNVPTPREREEILRKLLEGETLGPGVTHYTLAQRTQYYTGSDLKNMCVAAATSCVGEQSVDTEARMLMWKHFNKAMETIKPSSQGDTGKSNFQKFGRHAN
ncbi:P-loop containing nucleoside triphosphate hydrolase protein [Camillea tinctor]|nr:P-loop containing nucleoside triphosphate hydrolase protein [Camillea tinctor]